jgi:hypothetical protein
MECKKSVLDSSTLGKFVPFDILSVDDRTALARHIETIDLNPKEHLDDSLVHAAYTLYLLQGELALYADDRRVGTLLSGTELARFPLFRLRSGQLVAEANTPARLFRVERAVVSDLFSRHPANTSQDRTPEVSSTTLSSAFPDPELTAENPIASPPLLHPGQLNAELARAHAELEAALQDKAEATIARRISVNEAQAIRAHIDRHSTAFKPEKLVELRAKQAVLSGRSQAAGKALLEAQRRKLELEMAIRASNSDGIKARAQAEAICGRLRDEAHAHLRDEDKRLQQQYTRARERLAQLDQARRQAEERLQRERKRLEEEYAAARERLEKESETIRNAMQATKQRAKQRAEQIRAAQLAAESRVREKVEEKLRTERARLEAQLAESVQALESAQYHLNQAEDAKRAEEEKAKQLSNELGSRPIETQQPIAGSDRHERQGTPTDRTQKSEASNAASVADRRVEKTSSGKPTRLQDETDGAGTADGGDPTTDEERLLAELEAVQDKIAHATARMGDAKRARDSAELAKIAVEEQVATHQAVQDEIRLTLYEQAEEQLREECARSEQEAEKAKALVEVMGRTSDRGNEAPSRDEQTLISELHEQLKHAAIPLDRALKEQSHAEQRAALARSAQDEAAAQRLKMRTALHRARQHIAELKAKMEAPEAAHE